jgi:hypothetical protein
VTVEIGADNPKKYYIHKALLVHRSEYLTHATSAPT